MRSNNPIRTIDGTWIWISSFGPEFSNGKIIVVGPGVGLTQEYYYLFAGYLQEQGFTVITFDFRGVGQSAPQKLNGYEANVHQWAAHDINAVLLYARQHFPGKEIIYIGHCISGEIIGLAPGSQYINKIVLVSSSLSCARLWPLRDKIKIRVLKTFVDLLNRSFGYFPGKMLNIFGDLPKGVMYEWANWCDNPNGLFDSYPDNNYRKLNVPTLAYTFSDDWHCPPRAVKELLNRFANATITWYHIKPEELGLKKIGHNDFFEEGLKTTLWKHLSEWIKNEKTSDSTIKPLTFKRI